MMPPLFDPEVIKNFEVFFDPGGKSVGGWTLHRQGDIDCLDLRTVSELGWNLMIDCRRNGKLMIRGGVLRSQSRWWKAMDEPLVFYEGQLLALSIAVDLERKAGYQQRAVQEWERRRQEWEKQAQEARERYEKEREERRAARRARKAARLEREAARLGREREERELNKHRKYKREKLALLEKERVALNEYSLLDLLSDFSKTDWLLDQLSDHDFIALKFDFASRHGRDWEERRRWLAPL